MVCALLRHEIRLRVKIRVAMEIASELCRNCIKFGILNFKSESNDHVTNLKVFSRLNIISFSQNAAVKLLKNIKKWLQREENQHLPRFVHSIVIVKIRHVALKSL